MLLPIFSPHVTGSRRPFPSQQHPESVNSSTSNTSTRSSISSNPRRLPHEPATPRHRAAESAPKKLFQFRFHIVCSQQHRQQPRPRASDDFRDTLGTTPASPRIPDEPPTPRPRPRSCTAVDELLLHDLLQHQLHEISHTFINVCTTSTTISSSSTSPQPRLQPAASALTHQFNSINNQQLKQTS